MGIRLLIALLLTLAAAPACAQPRADAAEIAFWESVRDSRNPAELQAYLQQYPNGVFRPLAEARLAALQRPAAAPSPSRPAPVAAAPPVAWTMPKAGDQWTYRWRETKRAGAPEHTVAITVVSTADGEIRDQATIDGATPPLELRHLKGSHLLAQGPAVFSPYLPALGALPAPRYRVDRVEIDNSACGTRALCDAKGRVMGMETVQTPAGIFNATKVFIEHSWRPTFAGSGGGTGGRRLWIWYAPEVKRAVKYSSSTIVGANPPIEPDFELELVSYKVH
jgi:hypothetical protein